LQLHSQEVQLNQFLFHLENTLFSRKMYQADVLNTNKQTHKQ
jgi:hypothetical protein